MNLNKGLREAGPTRRTKPPDGLAAHQFVRVNQMICETTNEADLRDTDNGIHVMRLAGHDHVFHGAVVGGDMFLADPEGVEPGESGDLRDPRTGEVGFEA